MMTMTKVDRERSLCQAVTRERAAALTFDLLLASIEHGRGVLSVVSGQLPELWDPLSYISTPRIEFGCLSDWIEYPEVRCRIGAATTGAFGVVVRSDGLMVTILRRLELVHEPYDGGPFLYLSPGNAENHAFALKPAPESACSNSA